MINKNNICYGEIINDGKTYFISRKNEFLEFVDCIPYNKENREETIHILKRNLLILKNRFNKDIKNILFKSLIIIMTVVVFYKLPLELILKIISIILLSIDFLTIIILKKPNLNQINKMIKSIEKDYLLNETYDNYLNLYLKDENVKESLAYKKLQEQSIIDIDDLYQTFGLPKNKTMIKILK